MVEFNERDLMMCGNCGNAYLSPPAPENCGICSGNVVEP
jgi:rubrerythrin